MMTIVSHKQPDDTTRVVIDTRLSTQPAKSPFRNSEPVQHWRARWYEWEDILREAENNPALDDLIKKAEMVYALTK